MENHPEPQSYSYIRSKKLRMVVAGDDQEMNMLSEAEIVDIACPDSVLWELRARLWVLIDKRESDLRKYGKCDKLTLDEVREGICTAKVIEHIVRNPMKSAFLARPLSSPEDRREDLVRAANARLWEILALPIVDPVGKPDKGLAKIVFDTAKMVIDREYGTAIQRTETLARIQTQQIPTEPISVEALEADIKALYDRTEHVPDQGEIEGEAGSPK